MKNISKETLEKIYTLASNTLLKYHLRIVKLASLHEDVMIQANRKNYSEEEKSILKRNMREILNNVNEALPEKLVSIVRDNYKDLLSDYSSNPEQLTEEVLDSFLSRFELKVVPVDKDQNELEKDLDKRFRGVREKATNFAKRIANAIKQSLELANEFDESVKQVGDLVYIPNPLYTNYLVSDDGVQLKNKSKHIPAAKEISLRKAIVIKTGCNINYRCADENCEEDHVADILIAFPGLSIKFYVESIFLTPYTEKLKNDIDEEDDEYHT